MVVQKTLVAPPSSRLGVVTPEERQTVLSNSPVRGLYDQAVDRESAFETLRARAETAAQQAAEAPPVMAQSRTRQEHNPVADMFGDIAKSVIRSAGTQMGRSLVRGLLGNMFKGR